MSLLKHTTIWTGNTYEHRDYIRSIGGRWDAARKAWIVPPQNMRQRSVIRIPRGVDVQVSR